MEEEYLCINCKYCFDFFTLMCYKTGRECPTICTECDDYEEVKE